MKTKTHSSAEKKTTNRKKTVCVFGESQFDVKSIVELVLAARPDISRVICLASPCTLRRETEVSKQIRRSSLVTRLINAAQVQYDVVGVVSHRDLDAVEPHDDPSQISVDESAHLAQLQSICLHGRKIIATAPAWEIEAWWLMWPDEVAKHRPNWKRLKDRNGKRVDRIENAKEVLRRELRPCNKGRVPDYSETDSPYIAKLIKEAKSVRSPKGVSIALKRFLAALDEIEVN